MTVRELKMILNLVDDNLPVCVDGYDAEGNSITSNLRLEDIERVWGDKDSSSEKSNGTLNFHILGTTNN